MAYNLNKPAKGDAKNTGAPGPTPAPTKDTAWGRTNLGANSYGGPSSIEPGTKASIPLGDAMAAAQDDGQGALAKIQAHGVAGAPSPQIRPIDPTQEVPSTFGHRSRNGE